jgi:hypothetical protein
MVGKGCRFWRWNRCCARVDATPCSLGACHEFSALGASGVSARDRLFGTVGRVALPSPRLASVGLEGQLSPTLTSSAAVEGRFGFLGCGWPILASAATLNVAYPETNATYWTQPIDLAPGDPNGSAYAAMHDAQLTPTSGANFLTSAVTPPLPPTGRYRLSVVPGPAGGGTPNTLPRLRSR